MSVHESRKYKIESEQYFKFREIPYSTVNWTATVWNVVAFFESMWKSEKKSYIVTDIFLYKQI